MWFEAAPRINRLFRIKTTRISFVCGSLVRKRVRRLIMRRMAEVENYVEVREEDSINLNFVNSGSSRKKKGKGNLMYIFMLC